MKIAWIASGIAITAAALAPRPAEALDFRRSYEVYLFNGTEKVDTGKWIIELNEYVDHCGYEACSYFAKWISPGTVTSPVQLFFDELLVPGYFDCDQNSLQAVPTLIKLSPDYKSTGVDKFQQNPPIKSLILSERSDGSAVGIISYGTNFPYPILVQPCP